MNCPFCDKNDLPYSINRDSIECQKHGAISGLFVHLWETALTVETKIDLMAEHFQSEINGMVWLAKSENRQRFALLGAYG